MFSVFLEYPIITGITIVLSLVFVSVVSNMDPRLGEIINTNAVLPMIEIGIFTVLWILLTIKKTLLTEKVKKKKRARVLKNRNRKE